MSESVVLTGGANGMGRATALRLLARGCKVTVLDVVDPGLDTAFVPCDLSDTKQLEAVAASLPEPIDALVNCAGIAGPKPERTVMAVNFLGLRHLTEQLFTRIAKGGTVVNVSSTAGRDWQKREPIVRELLDTPDFDTGMAWLDAHENEWTDNPYKFSKQCASAWTYRAAGQALAHQVRVNCVNPGAVETQLTPAFRELVGNELYEWGVNQIGRHAQPDDVAAVIEWLAVGDCKWLNGVEIVVDGGYIAGLVDGWIDPTQAPAPS